MKNLYKKTLITTLILLSYTSIYSQQFELIKNGDFSLQTNPHTFGDEPLLWNSIPSKSVQSEDFGGTRNEAHIVPGVRAFSYPSITSTSCITVTSSCGPLMRVTLAPGSDFAIVSDLLAVSGAGGSVPITPPIASLCNCSTPSRIFGSSFPADDRFVMLTPGHGIVNKGGMAHKFDCKLLEGDYTFTINVLIPFPTFLQSNGLEVHLSKTSNSRDNQIFAISPSEVNTMTPGVWRTFTRSITIDGTDSDEFEHLVITNQSHCNNSTPVNNDNTHIFFIDDVSLVQNDVQNNGACSRSNNGPMTPNVFGPENKTVCADNLLNVVDFKMEIFSPSGQSIQTIAITNPKKKVCWDVAQNVATGTYSAEVTTSNGLCKQKLTKTFTHIKGPDWTFFTDYSSGSSIMEDKECCLDIIDVSNKTFSQNEDYVSPNKIIFGPNITINGGVNIFLQAGVEIDVIQPITILAGATFEAVIEPCIPVQLEQPKPNLGDGISNLGLMDENDLEGQILKSNLHWEVYPNPSTTTVFIDLQKIGSSGYNLSKSTVEFFNSQGKLVKKVVKEQNLAVFSVNISNLQEGVYYLKYSNDLIENKFSVKKLVILAN